MSVTSNTDDDWEYSKENIQPLQHGRKPDLLKLALRENPEDPIQQQKQAFENELRTYSGNDPLSVWFKYINWVEQNFLKGGRDGHFENLVKKCVTMFKDDKNYCDDKRFVSVWLKFANVSVKPIEVFNYMFSNNIGCYTASFYIAWSWELEQQDNIKKANQVLYEGINRNADPVDKLKSYLSEFEIRVSRKLSENGRFEQSPDAENQRSAFTILKTHRKTVPIERTGDRVEQPTRSTMTVGHLQPAPKSGRESSSKMSFKIYNSKAPASSLPIQKVGNVPFIFHTDSIKENEIKPSKWNKVKVKQTVPINQPTSSKDLNFDFHRDDEPQPVCTPRLIPKVSNVLRSHHHSKSPPMILFEPPDPMKCPMYDRNKVYGGAEEFSLEEIRAAAWLKNNDLFGPKKNCSDSVENFQDFPIPRKNLGFDIYSDEDKQVISTGQQKRFRTKEESPVRALFSPVNPAKYPVYDRDLFYKGREELSFEEIKANAWLQANKNLLEKNMEELKFPQQFATFNKVDESECHYQSKKQSYKNIVPSICTEPRKIIKKEFSDKSIVMPQFGQGVKSIQNIKNQDMKEDNKFDFPSNHSNLKASYNQHDSLNKLLGKLPSESYLGVQSITENLHGKCSNSTSYCEAANMLAELYNGTIANPVDNILKSEYLLNAEDSNSTKICNANANGMGLPFTLFQDPTENIARAKSANLSPNEIKARLPFEIFQEHTNNSIQKENMQIFSHLKEHLPIKSNSAFTFYEDPIENILKNPLPEAIAAEPMNDENAENIPPQDYIQETIRRETNGVLTPSQNIMFVPLELQDCEEDDPDDVQVNQCALQNETLVPTCNTEQFFSAPFISSTPFTSAKNKKKINLQTSENTYNYGSHMSNAKVENVVSSQTVTNSTADKQVFRPEKMNGAARPISSLSVIMETSKESYKSSASSGSSASATRLSQFDQYHSYEKSSITHKECSRVDIFKEPKPIGIEHNISNIKKAINAPEASVEKSKVILHENVNDPFDMEFTNKLLKSLKQPPDYYRILDNSQCKFRLFKIGDVIEIKMQKYLIETMIAEGAYGKVFVGEKENGSPSLVSKFALKACKHSNEWELYICFILQERLLHMNSLPDVSLSTMNILAAKKFNNGIILISEYCPHGTLLDLVNIYKKDKKSVPEPLVLYLTLELLQTMLKIHECKIIHTDIKPDNILIRNIPDKFDLTDAVNQTCILQFIDFGRSIDLNFFVSNVSFNIPVKNRCSEIIENKPWLFQLDWCGILDCIHTLLFQEYMRVKKTESGRWSIENRFRRYHATEIWTPLFDELLNIPTCYEQPNILGHVSRIKEKLLQVSANLKFNLNTLCGKYYQK